MIMNLSTRTIFFLILITKVIIGSFLASQFLTGYFIPFVDFFVESSFKNPYHYFMNKNQPDMFPYPSLMLYILTVPKLLFGWLSPDPKVTFFDLFIYRLPLIIADISIFLIIRSWLKDKTTKLIQFYWLSPVLIYITYIHGQLDVIPIAFLFGGFYFLFKGKLTLSGLFVGLGCACKTNIILILPFYILYLLSKNIQVKEVFFICGTLLSSFFLVNLPFIFDSSFIKMVFQNQEQEKLFQFVFTLGDLSLYVAPSCILILILKAALVKRFNRDILMMFLGFSFSIILLLVPVMQGWYFWLVPFLTYFYMKEEGRSKLLFWGIQIAYLLYFGVISNTDYLEVFQLISPGIAGLISPYELFFQWGMDSNKIVNLSYTILQTLLLFNCIWIYQKGLESYRKHKITSTPFLIGIGGDSGAGKTTLSDAIQQIFNKSNTTILRGDDMHRWERGDGNWAKMTHLNPKANHLHKEVHCLKKLKNGKKIYRRHYDHSTGCFTNELVLNSNSLIMFEGLHPFYIQAQRALYDLKVFIKPAEELMKHWKIVRDSKNRKYDKETVLKQIEKRKSDSIEFIASQSQFADIVIEPKPLKPILSIQDDDEDIIVAYDVSFSNSIYIEPILEDLNQIDTLNFSHTYSEEDKQTLFISGQVPEEILMKIIKKRIPGLQDIGISDPKWQADAYGVILMIIVYCIFEKESYDRI